MLELLLLLIFRFQNPRKVSLKTFLRGNGFLNPTLHDSTKQLRFITSYLKNKKLESVLNYAYEIVFKLELYH